MKRKMLILMGFGLMALGCMAQDKKRQEVDMDSPTFVPTVRVGKVLEDGDSIQYMEMNNVYVFPPVSFSSKKQQGAYMRLVKNVKTVLPIAKEARLIMMETAAYLETLPSKKAREEHMQRVEKSIMQESLVELRTDTGFPRTRACRILSGICVGLWCFAEKGV